MLLVLKRFSCAQKNIRAKQGTTIKNLLYRPAGHVRVHNPVFPRFREQETPGEGTGYHCGALCHLSDRTGGVLHAAAVQTGHGFDDHCRCGLGRRNRISGGSCHHADLQYAVLAGTVGALADVLHGHISFLAGVLFRKGLLLRSRGSLCAFGALAAIVIYGGIMNPASVLMWANAVNLKIILTYYITGFPMDCVQAAAIWLFLWFGAEPMLEKLDRIKVKYGLVE